MVSKWEKPRGNHLVKCWDRPSQMPKQMPIKCEQMPLKKANANSKSEGKCLQISIKCTKYMSNASKCRANAS